MRATSLIATLLLGAGILTGGAMLVPALAQNGAAMPATASQGNWLTLHEVQLKLEALGYRELTKIEREDDKYEVKATDPQGQRVEIDVDPITGAVLDTEVKRSRRDDRRSADEPRTRLTVDPYSGDVIEGTAAERATNPAAPTTK